MKVRDNAIIPVTPAADHRGLEGYFVELDGSQEAAVVNAETDVPFGVILEGCNVGEKDSIAIPGGFAGTVRVKLAAAPGTVVLGTMLVVHSDGSAKEDDGVGNRVQVAQALESGAGDELIEASLITPVSLS